jgi:cytochrome c nitrite reductase small subunit
MSALLRWFWRVQGKGGVLLGLTGVLIALVVLTIVLAAVFLVRPSITTGATGKILAFVALFVLPTLCIGSGMSFHLQRSQQTAYCISCHSMESHGKSLYVQNASYIPAQHFQNHLVSPDKACYACHTNYTMYGPLTDKLKGLRYLYMEYVSAPPKTIHLDGTYSNLQCLHCHAGMRSFDENPTHTAIMGSLKTNRTSCISCHNTIHNASEVDHVKMWVDGDAPASAAPAPAPATAEPATAAAPSKATAGGSVAAGAGAGGRAIFDSQGCSGCHGAGGVGASGPALTRTSTQYPPAKLTAVLKTPTAAMKTAGMVPLTLNAADMKALVSYVTSLGGTPAAAAPPAPASAAPSAAPPATVGAPTNAAPAATASASAAATPPPAAVAPAAGAAPTKTPAGGSPAVAAAGGKAIFDSHGCSGCHGAAGVGASGPALTKTSTQYPPAKLTAVLTAPTAAMKAAGMVPLTLSAADMQALVSYVGSLGGTPAAAAATPPAAGSAPPSPATAAPAAANPSVGASAVTPAAGGSAAVATTAAGKAIFDSKGCSGCHGAAGVGASGPALTKTSTQYPPAKLTAVLQTPTAAMKTAGMVPLTLSPADMQALVSYVSSLGVTPAASGATPPAAGATTPPPAAPAKPESKPKGILKWLFAPSFPH